MNCSELPKSSLSGVNCLFSGKNYVREEYNFVFCGLCLEIDINLYFASKIMLDVSNFKRKEKKSALTGKSCQCLIFP